MSKEKNEDITDDIHSNLKLMNLRSPMKFQMKKE